MAKTDKKKRNLWTFFNEFEGDKVVWMIVLILIMISIVAIFSSTSQLALQQNTSRMDIIREQMLMSVVGLAVIIGCYNIRNINIFRILSQLGYAISIALLLFLALHIDAGIIKALYINHAWRVISVFGFQVHVFEVVKVAMVMYLAWAVDTYNKDGFWMANKLAEKHPFWKKKMVKKVAYIYFPIFSVCLLLMVGSLSSTIFIGGIMFLTILIAGIEMKELMVPAAVAVVGLLGCVLLNSAFETGKKPFPHLDSALARLSSSSYEKNIETIRNAPTNSIEFQRALDDIKQPTSAKIAIHEGGLFGKGPGRSTQKYIVPIIFEDYMFCFIVEEYGFLGGMAVLMLYISLLARGVIIIKNCNTTFAKTALAGLILLITGQALMHILINCDLGPLTGQTLPMISHGNSSFLMFSLAFGIILSISRIAKNKIAREAAKAAPIMEYGAAPADNVSNSLDELDSMESGMIDGLPDEESLTVHENDIPDYGLDDHNNE